MDFYDGGGVTEGYARLLAAIGIGQEYGIRISNKQSLTRLYPAGPTSILG